MSVENIKLIFIEFFSFRPIRNEHKQIKISVCGVDIMNDDPKCVRNLYGKIESDALQKIGDGILKRFIDAGKLLNCYIMKTPILIHTSTEK